MNIASRINNVAHTPVWDEVKKWNKEDKVNLITLLSVSLAQIPLEDETPEQKTKRMIAKYAGCWKGEISAEDIIRTIEECKHSSMKPLKF